MADEEQKKDLSYTDGLKVIKYLKEKTGLSFSFCGQQLENFILAFNQYCRDEDIIERTRAAYAALILVRSAEYRRDSAPLKNRGFLFDRALDKSPDLLDPEKRKTILNSINLNDIL